MELTGKRTELVPAAGRVMVPCAECGQTLVSVVLWARSSVVVRLVSRTTGEHLSRYTAEAVPCGHLTAIEENELKEKVFAFFAPAPEETSTHCKKCSRVFDQDCQNLTDSAHQYRNGPFCAGCVSVCTNPEIADHVCMIDRYYQPEVYR